MPAYNDADYNWFYSEDYHFISDLSQGKFTPFPPIVKKNPKEPSAYERAMIETFTIKDINEIPEKRRAGLGFWHLVEKRGGVEIFSGLKVNKHRWENDFYQFPDNPKITMGTITAFGIDGTRRWFNVQLPAGFDSSWAYIMAHYSQIWGNKISEQMQIKYIQNMYLNDRGVDRWLRQRKTWARQAGHKAKYVKKYPSRYLFKFTNRFVVPQNWFSFRHTLAVFCHLIKPGDIFEKPGPLLNIYEPVTWLGMAVGVHKSIAQGDFDALLDGGLVGKIMFHDASFPACSEISRLFELFNISMDALGLPKKNKRNNTRVINPHHRQYLGAIESPTVGIIRFPLLRKGAYLCHEEIRDAIKKGWVNKLRFGCHNVSAFQITPECPPSSGFPSNMQFVTVPIAKPFDKKIDYEEGAD